jgi:PKD repeat protein
MKKSYAILSALFMVSVLILNAYASITPATFDDVIPPGGSFSETKTVFIPGTAPKIDIVFAFDLSGTMQAEISTVRDIALTTLEALNFFGLPLDLQVGVMTFNDYPSSYDSYGYSSTYGLSSDYAYSLNQPLTDDLLLAKSHILALVGGGGADFPGCHTRPLYESYADSGVGWRTGAKRILLMFSDSVPHDNDLNEGVPGKVGVFSTGGDPGRDEIILNGDDLELQSILASMATNNVVLMYVQFQNPIPSDALDYWMHWASVTGGLACSRTSATSVVPTAIGVFADEIAGHVDSLSLRAESGYEGWLTGVVPAEYVDFDVPPEGVSKTFDVTVTVPSGTTPGTYSFSIVPDADGTPYCEQPVIITVIDNEPTFPPVADPNGPYTAELGDPITFDGTASYDTDGFITSYEWDFGDGNTGTGANPSHVYSAVGMYTVTLTVTEDQGQTNSAETTAEISPVTPIPLDPVADANGPYSGIQASAVHFDGSGSNDPDGTIVSYEWDFGDGNTGTGMNPSHIYTAAGVYTVTLTVTDDQGLTDSDETTAEILPVEPNVIPEVPFGAIMSFAAMGFALFGYFTIKNTRKKKTE